MRLLTIDYVPGREIEALGMAKGSVVQCKNFGRDFMSAMKNLVGGGGGGLHRVAGAGPPNRH